MAPSVGCLDDPHMPLRLRGRGHGDTFADDAVARTS
jgi:hypothetical protein